MKIKNQFVFLGVLSLVSIGTAFAAEDGSDVSATGVSPLCTVGLHIDKFGDVFASRGGEIDYKVVVHNTGTCRLSGLSVTDQLSQWVSFESASVAPHTHPAMGTFGGQLVFTGGHLNAGETGTLMIKVKVSPMAPNFILNQVCVSSPLRHTMCDTFGTRIAPIPTEHAADDSRVWMTE